MPKKASPFPKQILVTEERPDNDSSYLSIHEDEAELDAEQNADQEVAIYELKEIRRFVVTRDLVK
jgi:hypothetical protein